VLLCRRDRFRATIADCLLRITYHPPVCLTLSVTRIEFLIAHHFAIVSKYMLATAPSASSILNSGRRTDPPPSVGACHGTTVGARDLADLFLQNVFRLHGLPLTITSDRGPQFASAFWHWLCARLGIEPRLSTAFHPQTDGQTERINSVMEQYLRCYVNYLQDDWSEWLPLAEFASNNHTSETTATSPFFANLGYDPRWQFDLTAAAHHQPDDQGARSAVEALSEIHDHLRVEMYRAQLRHQESADEHRLPAPYYRVRGFV